MSIAANGDQFYSVTIAYVAPSLSKTVRIANNETLDLAWFESQALPTNMVPRYAQVVEDYLAQK